MYTFESMMQVVGAVNRDSPQLNEPPPTPFQYAAFLKGSENNKPSIQTP